MKPILLGVVVGTACTSLGPMPATTGVSAIPAGRPGTELQVAVMPVYRLSDAATNRTEDRHGRSAPQLLAVFEPDRLIHVPGLVLGARAWGADHDTLAEPFIGYRKRLGARLAGGLVVYGTAASATQNGASYRAKRAGAEALVDARLVRLTGWLALHAHATAQLTVVTAEGTYCVDEAGLGIDCSEDGPNTLVDASLTGLYPAGTGGIGFDVRRKSGILHSARLTLLAAAGRMPRLRDGRQKPGDTYTSAGLMLTLGFGSSD